MDEKNNYLYLWFLPFNGFQDGTPYSRRPVVNIPEFVPLYNSINREILHSFHYNFILSPFVLKDEGNDEEEKIYIYLYHPKVNS